MHLDCNILESRWYRNQSAAASSGQTDRLRSFGNAASMAAKSSCCTALQPELLGRRRIDMAARQNAAVYPASILRIFQRTLFVDFGEHCSYSSDNNVRESSVYWISRPGAAPPEGATTHFVMPQGAPVAIRATPGPGRTSRGRRLRAVRGIVQRLSPTVRPVGGRAWRGWGERRACQAAPGSGLAR